MTNTPSVAVSNLISSQCGRLDVEFNFGARRQPIYFSSLGIDFCWDGSAEACASLLPAIVRCDALQLQQPVQPEFAAHLGDISNIYRHWLESDKRLELNYPLQPSEADAAPASAGVGCFFTGGVDSFYSFLKNRSDVTHLVYVYGFDVKLSQTKVRDQISRSLNAVAQEFGVKLIEVETNFREVMDETAAWGEFTHGAALATIAHLLKSQFGKIIIPASYTYNHLFAWGSHPLLDPLWSDASLRFVHDGCEARRSEKVKVISGSAAALKWLRVCYMTDTTEYNCGKCQKCQRTMINLIAADAWDRCSAFPGAKINFRKLKFITGQERNTRTFLKDNIDALSGRTDPLSVKVRKALETSYRRSKLSAYLLRSLQQVKMGRRP